MDAKTLDNVDVAAVQKAVPDVKVVGNGDLWQLLSKASSENQGWMKSCKAMEIEGAGCCVQVTTQQKNIDGTYSVAEAVTFVPGAVIVSDINAGRKLVVPPAKEGQRAVDLATVHIYATLVDAAVTALAEAEHEWTAATTETLASLPGDLPADLRLRHLTAARGLDNARTTLANMREAWNSAIKAYRGTFLPPVDASPSVAIAADYQATVWTIKRCPGP